MATLILSAVGTAFGGPIGGMIGAVVGQQLDSVIFAPKARHGPRLGELAVQTSSYGHAIPRIFGTMRVAGTVIWSTDLIERRSAGSGGKGRPKSVAYSYSASFAVALSARPLRAVRRIWADGKLLRGAAGDFKSACLFRLHEGGEDQPVDPLIAAAEGLGQAPAYRGLAYAVFEDLELEDFGNRIPSLSFEVEADPGPVTIGAIARELSGSAVAAGITPALTGYAAGGDSVRAAVEALADVVPLSLTDDGDSLGLSAVGPPPVLLGAEEEGGRREIVRRAADAVPDEVSLAYYEPERDFQAGLQRAVSGSGGPRLADRRALPAALAADGAKALAEFRLAALRAARMSAKLELGWARAAVRPGDQVRLDGEAGVWKVARWTLGPMIVGLELRRVTGAPLPDPVAASAGRAVGELDRRHGATMLRLYDLPLGEPRGGQPLLFAVAAGVEEGWRRAGLIASFDGGGSWRDAGTTAAPAILGSALSALPSAGPVLVDAQSSVEVELLNGAMWLEHASDDALMGGANLALLGGELIQFGRAEWQEGRRFLLSRLLRGRRGTEWAAASHQTGEDFALLEAEAMAVLEAPAGSAGGEARLTGSGVGDGPEAATASVPISGESLRPPSPAHLTAERLAAGDIAVRWVRRSREGWSWPSGGDTPLGEEAEAYRLTVSGDGFERTIVTAEPEWLYAAALQAEDGAAGILQLSVSQIGTYAASRPALLTFV